MKIQDVNPSIIGHRVSCIENGYRVTGTIKGIREDENCVYVKIEFDKPLTCWYGDFENVTESWEETEYESWGRKMDGFGNLQYTTIIDTLDWLKDYKPEDRHFTSQSEMDMIAMNLGLEGLTNEQLQAKRDEIVALYWSLDEDVNWDDPKEREIAYNRHDGMMSVTAVIDHYKFNRGMEV